MIEIGIEHHSFDMETWSIVMASLIVHTLLEEISYVEYDNP